MKYIGFTHQRENKQNSDNFISVQHVIEKQTQMILVKLTFRLFVFKCRVLTHILSRIQFITLSCGGSHVTIRRQTKTQ
jgi:hypothetical protein